jgi:hypothetical protein
MSIVDSSWCVALLSAALFGCGPGVGSDPEEASSTDDTVGVASSDDATDSGDTTTATDAGGVASTGESSGATSSADAETSAEAGAETGAGDGFRCGDDPCDLAAQSCVYCAPPGGAVCVDATMAMTPRDAAAWCERAGPGLVVVSCSSPQDCRDADESCMWTEGFGSTTVACDPLACAASCSCTPQLRPVCDTLADCPACATACDDSLELGLPIRTCK